MKLIFSNSRPFSINEAYYKRTFTHTVAYKEWAKGILLELRKTRNMRALLAFKDTLSGAKALNVKMTYYSPIHRYFNKEGDINLQTKDLSNSEKLLQDTIFHGIKKYLGLDINDKIVIDLHSKKHPTPEDEYYMIVSIEDDTKTLEILRDLRTLVLQGE